MYTTFTLSALYDERFAIWLLWAKNLHPALYTLSYLNYIYIFFPFMYFICMWVNIPKGANVVVALPFMV
jgi:hypothetical protein